MASASLQAASMRHCAQQSVSQPGLESWMYLRDWFAVLTRAFLLVPDRASHGQDVRGVDSLIVF